MLKNPLGVKVSISKHSKSADKRKYFGEQMQDKSLKILNVYTKIDLLVVLTSRVCLYHLSPQELHVFRKKRRKKK